jgi:hypothetical protein
MSKVAGIFRSPANRIQARVFLKSASASAGARPHFQMPLQFSAPSHAVCYKHSGLTPQAGRGAGFAYGGHKPLAVGVVIQDRLAPVAAIQHMINRAGMFYPQLPGHEPDLITFRVRVKTRTLFRLIGEHAERVGPVAQAGGASRRPRLTSHYLLVNQALPFLATNQLLDAASPE